MSGRGAWGALRLIAASAISVTLPITSMAYASVSYSYAPAGRLTSALYDTGMCILYTYDASGNRTNQTAALHVQATPVWGSATWGCFKWTP